MPFAIKPYAMSACEIAEACKTDQSIGPKIIEFYLSRNKNLKGRLNSHLAFDENDIDKQVEILKTKDLKLLPLPFVPILIKDNICVRGMPTTCASQFLKNYFPPFDATVIERLKKAGAIIFGKANCDEFAMGSSNENSAYGPVKNPWNLDKVPGGSSGGSAAAVAADLVPLAIGSDTGGSIRQPASFCGVHGLKPTYGAVSRYGLVAFSSSLDQIGPLSRSIRDLALTFDVIKGHDQRDSTSSRRNQVACYPILQTIQGQKNLLNGIKIGLIREFFSEGLNSEVKSAIETAVSHLESQGAIISWVSLPLVNYAMSAYYTIATAEASSNLARFDGIRFGHRAQSAQATRALQSLYEETRQEGFGPEVKRRIFLGTFVLSAGYRDAYYAKAVKLRHKLSELFDQAFKEVDLLLGPTAPTTAFGLGEKTKNPVEMYLSDIYTISANLAELPALSQFCGFSTAGLPIGMQFIGPKFSEGLLLKGALAYEQTCPWAEGRQPSGF